MLTVTEGQVAYEKTHLLKKLQTRDPEKYISTLALTSLDVHTIFEIIPGEIENWEFI